MIKEFRGDYRFLSNFYPVTISYDGLYYPSVEHAFQAAKTNSVEDKLKICNAESPGIAKRMGRMVELRPDWEQVKIPIMTELVRIKFRNPGLRAMLIRTGLNELCEGNWWHDEFWGVDCVTGNGQNHLGKILMMVRDEIMGVAR